MDGTGARIVAWAALGKVLRRRLALDESLDLDGLDDAGRAFARRLAATTLKRLGQIDRLIGHCLDRPLPVKAHRVQDLLRLGVAQLVFLGVAPHAAVDTAVALARQAGLSAHVKLVNAVLRRLAAEGPALAAGQDAARLNTPDWLWDSWVRAYGDRLCRAIAAAHLEEAPLDLSVKAEPSHWAAALDADLLPTGSLRRAAGVRIATLPGYDQGAWWVQDAAAALPVQLLGRVAGLDVADIGAAPGGKTAQLAAAGARVTAVDRSAPRLGRLADNLARLGLQAEVVEADAGVWQPSRVFDAVLLDAPCSATGTLRRHPDATWLKQPGDVAKLARLQDRLLAAAAGWLRPGGLLVYCTCSLQPEEGPERVAALLADGAPFRRLPIDAAQVGGLAELVSADGDLRTLPCHLGEKGGMDGFYAARLERL